MEEKRSSEISRRGVAEVQEFIDSTSHLDDKGKVDRYSGKIRKFRGQRQMMPGGETPEDNESKARLITNLLRKKGKK